MGLTMTGRLPSSVATAVAGLSGVQEVSLAVKPSDLRSELSHRLTQGDTAQPNYVMEMVARVLAAACDAQASDIHFTPGETELVVLWRIDGVLQPVATIPRKLAANVVARLKVLGDLLTYRTDIPQEGRLREGAPDTEMRLSTFPTLYGEKAVVRLFAGSGRYQWPSDLGLPEDILSELLVRLRETSGALLITGPAGSGKTTTAYACLRTLHRESGAGKSLVSLEDPIETVLAGVAQSQVNRSPEFDYAIGLRSLLRQDPDAILVGEIRDRETVETVFQACLTGHLVLSTFHAGSAAEAVSRLSDMGIEPYLLRTGLLGIVCQRLFRSLCECAVWTDDEAAKLGFEAARVRVSVGCDACQGTGYRGRMLLAELLDPNAKDVGRAILARSDATELHVLAERAGMKSMNQRAAQSVAAGNLSPVEARRVLGFRGSPVV
jgi:general secretion pathway protein E